MAHTPWPVLGFATASLRTCRCVAVNPAEPAVTLQYGEDLRTLHVSDVRPRGRNRRRITYAILSVLKHKVRAGKYVRYPDERLWSHLGLTRLVLRTARFPWANA